MLDVQLEFSRKLHKTASKAELQRLLESAAPILAQVLGERIRDRVRRRGDTAGQHVEDWNDRYGPVLVSGRYPGASSGVETASGARLFESNRAFHRATGAQLGRYSMAGLSRVIASPTLVHLQFRGRSEGQDARVINGRSRPLKASNALKAWTVFRTKRVHLLALSDEELRAVEVGMVHNAALAVGSALPVQWDGVGPAASTEAIFRQLLRQPRGQPIGDTSAGV